MKVTDEMVEAARKAYDQTAMHPRSVTCSKCKGQGYHHGFGEDGADPDWCIDCGGGGYEFPDDEDAKCMRAAITAAITARPSPTGEAVPVAFVDPHSLKFATHYNGVYVATSVDRSDVYSEPVYSAATIAALAARPKVRVKAMEWEEIYRSRSGEDPDSELVGFEACNGFDEWYWIEIRAAVFVLHLVGFDRPTAVFETEREAKTAAQTDYERRILAALEDGQ